MPAWATVVLTLGVALIAALGGITSGLFLRRSAKDQFVLEPWRRGLVDTTGDFIDAWHDFRSFLRARSLPSAQALRFDAEAREEADRLGTKCAQTIDKVMLGFGRTTPCGKAAAALDEAIWKLKQDVLNTQPGPQEWAPETKRMIWDLLDTVNRDHEEFVWRAHIACKPADWKEPEGEPIPKSPRARSASSAGETN